MTMQPYTYLRFRELGTLIDYMKKIRLHQYGLVISPDISHPQTKDHSIASISLCWRVTAKDPARQEILIMDLLYYNDIYVTIDHAKKESAESQKKGLEWIDKEFQEHTKDGYQFTRLEAEWKVNEH